MDSNQQTRLFGEVKVIFDVVAEVKSISFLCVSPDGKRLVFTYHNYGCFPIWHKESDLYSIKLIDLKVERLDVSSFFYRKLSFVVVKRKLDDF